jgi:hypothetical protein
LPSTDQLHRDVSSRVSSQLRDAMEITWGVLNRRRDLRGVRCGALLAYDVFNVVFLNRPGTYVLRDSSSACRCCAEQTIAYLKRYHRALMQTGNYHPHLITSSQLQDWWMLNESARSILKQTGKDIADNVSCARYLRSLTPIAGIIRQSFFESLVLYLPLFLSTTVALQPSKLLRNTKLSYGIVCSAPVDPGEHIRGVLGQLVRLSTAEAALLREHGLDHSIVCIQSYELGSISMSTAAATDEVIDLTSDNSLDIPSMRRKSKKKRLRNERWFAVVGGLSFLNDACSVHANAWPCTFREQGSDVGNMQWQVAESKRQLLVGEEVFVSYADDVSLCNSQHPCVFCDP